MKSQRERSTTVPAVSGSQRDAATPLMLPTTPGLHSSIVHDEPLLLRLRVDWASTCKR